jgi:hypothetical protein
MRLYILDGAGNPVPCDNTVVWAKWFEAANRHVGDTRVGESRVSTVFLGLDHNFGSGPPVLYESMVFLESGSNGTMERYRTRAEALVGHQQLVRAIEAETQLAHYLTMDTLGAIVAELRAAPAPAPAAAAPKRRIHHEARPLGAVSARRRRRHYAYAARAYQLQAGAH